MPEQFRKVDFGLVFWIASENCFTDQKMGLEEGVPASVLKERTGDGILRWTRNGT